MRAGLAMWFVLTGSVSACAASHPALTVHLGDYGEHVTTSDRIRIDIHEGEAPVHAERTPVVDGRDFKSASFGSDSDGLPQISLCFTSRGRARFAQVVEGNMNRRLVFLIEGRLLMAPIIESAQAPECEIISGYVSQAEANALRRAIK